MKILKLLNGYMARLIRYTLHATRYTLIILLFLVSCFLFPATPVYADCWDEAIENDVVKLKGLECIFSQILNIVARLAGLAVFVMLILGGWQYITSGGEKQAAQKARNTLTYAILGLVLLIGSWFILRFIKFFTGVEVTNFVIIPD